MCDKTRLASKKVSKENVIRAQHDIRGVSTEGSYLYAGPSDYIAHYRDRKVATFRLELAGFGGAPVTLDARLQVEDSPNSAGVVVDAVRFLKVARELGLAGSLRGASAFTQKTPPQQLMFREARDECDALAARTLTVRTRAQVAAAGVGGRVAAGAGAAGVHAAGAGPSGGVAGGATAVAAAAAGVGASAGSPVGVGAMCTGGAGGGAGE